MEDEDLKYLNTDAEFDRFLNDLDGESDRGAVLSGACMLELQVSRCVDAYFSKGKREASKRLLRPDGPLGSFASKVDILCCLGGIDEFEYTALHQVRKLRNIFAHDLLVSFEIASVGDRATTLASHVLQEIEPLVLKKLKSQGPRRCFTAATFVLCDMLKLRPMLISSMSSAIKHDFADMNRQVAELIDSKEDDKE